MPSKIIVIGIILMSSCLAAVYFFMPDNTVTIHKDSSPTLVEDDKSTPMSEVPARAQTPTTLSAPISNSTGASLIELEATLASTILEREAIEEQLRVIELKVGALEGQVDDIELRGDNPADVQDETLDSFQAIFAEYQDAISAFDRIKAQEDRLIAKIAKIKK